MILYAAADLIWSTKIKEMANSVGVEARPARTVEMLEARLADSPVKALLVDLEKGEEGLALIRRLRGEGAQGSERGIRILAWGPHVAKELLQKARDLGADEVLTRGAFDHGMGEILVRLEGRMQM